METSSRVMLIFLSSGWQAGGTGVLRPRAVGLAVRWAVPVGVAVSDPLRIRAGYAPGGRWQGGTLRAKLCLLCHWGRAVPLER